MRLGLRLGTLTALCATVLIAAGPPESPVADAAMRGDAEAIVSLLRSGADVNAAQGDGMTAMHWAAERDDVAMAEVLRAAGALLEPTTRIVVSASSTPMTVPKKAIAGTSAAASSKKALPITLPAVIPPR